MKARTVTREEAPDVPRVLDQKERRHGREQRQSEELLDLVRAVGRRGRPTQAENQHDTDEHQWRREPEGETARPADSEPVEADRGEQDAQHECAVERERFEDRLILEEADVDNQGQQRKRFPHEKDRHSQAQRDGKRCRPHRHGCAGSQRRGSEPQGRGAGLDTRSAGNQRLQGARRQSSPPPPLAVTAADAVRHHALTTHPP